ncbi:T9SS type A sorting domain-containing protein [Chryseobacterium sp. PBS4-4]|uniref:T9SS type A sorting domain-containing protein n=1 Tax=Chryseobacterium edaphi TaxID=2976532 RepID=A0ABT2W869_9FLAO|nr:T9SS type A sorting domain-containing protein [Chryseobacterium edaphi]MCU7618391.1 T9SS type A sorting domain-containing protein [Chryseobacterium edaphi]
MKKSFLSLGILLSIQFGFAQSVDTNFGSNGTVTHAEKGSFFQTTLLPDGKMIFSGNFESSTSKKAVILKLNADGSLDQTFATAGVFTMDLYANTNYFEGFSKVLVQSDGKLFFAYGNQLDNGIDPESLTLNLMRLNANGTLDTTFTNPWTTTTTDIDNAPMDFKILSSGKYLSYGPNYMMRFNSNGSLDTTYGTNGIRTITFEINDVYVNGDNVYIDGHPTNNTSNRTLYKLLNETAGISGSNNYVTGRVYQNNASFYIDKNNSSVHELLKLDSNLAPDAAFGINGKVSLSTQLYVSQMLFQSGGSVIMYANNGSSSQTDHTFTRLNYNGAVNTGFGQGGTFTMTIPNSTGFESYADVLVHPNGSIYNLFYGNNNTNNIFLKRILLPNEVLAVKDDIKANHKISILENPVGNILKLSDDLENGNIYNISGKLIMSNLKGSEHTVNSLPKGVYIISDKGNNGQVSNLKFIKK